VLCDFDAFDGDAGLFADEAREKCAGVRGAEREPGEVQAARMPQRASSSTNARSNV